MLKLLLGAVLALAPLTSVFATDTQTFEGNIVMSGLWVDACMVEYGEINCSDYAVIKSASAFCRNKGYESSYGTVYHVDEGTGHETWRLTASRRNGVDSTEWRHCGACGSHISKVTCIRR